MVYGGVFLMPITQVFFGQLPLDSSLFTGLQQDLGEVFQFADRSNECTGSLAHIELRHCVSGNVSGVGDAA